jgi:hypothetical protein
MVIFDNCAPETIEELRSFAGIKEVKITNFGNAGSLRHCLQLSSKRPPEETIYFVEDDYLHKSPASIKVIEEGLTVADYVTLYDHPDKYGNAYNKGETCKIMRTSSTHWKHTVSTTMTFASKAKVIKSDLEIWDKNTNGRHPNDHYCFQELGDLGRKLACAIPGMATHCDLKPGGIESQPSWAVDYMIRQYMSRMPWDNEVIACVDQIMNMERSRGDKLKMIHAYLNMT